jgi:hypothetical protein
MTDKDEDLKVEFTDLVKGQIAADPKLAEAMKEFLALMHQAHDAVRRGQHKSIDDALEALTGSRPQKIDSTTGEVIAGATMQSEIDGLPEGIEFLGAFPIADPEDGS